MMKPNREPRLSTQNLALSTQNSALSTYMASHDSWYVIRSKPHGESTAQTQLGWRAKIPPREGIALANSDHLDQLSREV
jgi:hypothetical protein